MRRLQCDTALWHVFARGTRRLELFQDDEDFSRFLFILAFAVRDSGCKLIAYAIMGNHYHLMVEASSKVLSECMHHLNRLYARHHNERYSHSGHVFDGPYRAYRQPTTLLGLWKVAYVFLNPVKAGLCSVPEDYWWSGYRSFVGLEGNPLKLDPTSFMRSVDPDASEAWKRFRFCMETESRRPSRVISGRPSMIQVHVDQFGWLLDYARQALQSFPDEDPMAIAVYWARKCGIAPRAMAAALGQKDTYEIRQTLKRFKARLSKEPNLARFAELP